MAGLQCSKMSIGLTVPTWQLRGVSPEDLLWRYGLGIIFTVLKVDFIF